jgi:hypothetical protein
VRSVDFTHIAREPDVDYVWADEIDVRHLKHHLGPSCKLATRDVMVDGRALPENYEAVVSEPVLIMIAR